MEKILVVDDNLTNLQVLVKTLSGLGHELLIAQSGEEALKTAKEIKPALILLDIMMPPGIDGYEVCRRLKADVETQDSIVIFLSANNEVEDKVKGFEVGAVDYIAKPFQVEEVTARVKSQMLAYEKFKEFQRLKKAEEGVMNVDWVKSVIAGGESETSEFKSTMRWNIRAKKTDKNIEIAWLKGIVAFLNSKGGTLLIGVDDDGNFVDLKIDGFPSEDKFLLHFNNLIKAHIGLEYASFIQVHFITIEGHQILAVKCDKSPSPAFLKHQENEDFYIRVGPASRKLSTREVLEYVKINPFEE